MVCGKGMYRGGRPRWAVLAALVLALLAALPGPVLAQGGTVTYGNVVTGSLTAEAPFAIYGFNGNQGDHVTVHVLGMAAGLQPRVSLLGPDQRQLAVSDDDPLRTPGSSLARLAYRLPQTGAYSLIVSNLNNTPGDFMLYLTGTPVVSTLTLLPGAPQMASLAPGAPPVTYAFAPDSAAQTVLTLGTETPNFTFVAQVYDGRGGLLAALTGGTLREVQLVIAPDSGQYTLGLSSLAGTQGTVQVALGIGAAATPALETQPTQATPTVCQVTSGLTVNVRLGPSTDYPIIGALYPGTALDVIGQNAARTWFAVDYNGRQGWVASSVVVVGGPCGSLPQLEAPPLPTAAPNPTATPVPTAQISFTVNGGPTATITAGECATVAWDVRNVREVFYQGAGVPGSGSVNECPASTTTYTLRVILLDGSTVERTVAINVNPAPVAQPDLYVSEFSLDPATPVQGMPVEVRIGVYNGGDAAVPATPHRVEWYPGEAYPSPGCQWTLDSIAAHGGRILTCTYAGYPSWYPSINTLVVVDATNAIAESNEGNNRHTQAVTVTAP